MVRKKSIKQIFADFFFFREEKDKILIRKVYFEIKRFQDGETHRGEFEIQRVLFVSRSEFLFFAKAFGHAEDTKPYSCCIGRGNISVPLLNSFNKNEILERIKKALKNKNIFGNIIFLGLQDGSIAFGPGANDNDRTVFISQTGLQIKNWHTMKVGGFSLNKKKLLYASPIYQKITKALVKCLK